MKKNNILINTAYLEKFRLLSNEQFGRLIRALLEYQETGEKPKIGDVMVALAFDGARVELDINNEKYEQTSQRLSEAGKKGAEKRWSKQPEEIASDGKAKKANSQNDQAKKANSLHSPDGLNDKCIMINDKCINDKREKKKGAGAVWTESEELNQAIKNFIEHRKLMKKPMTAHAIELFIKKLQKLAPTEAQQIALINKSIEKGWLDVYADDKATDPPKAPSGKLAALEQHYLQGGK